MRRLLLPLLILAALPLTGTTPASACANPAEGEPNCCPPRYLVEIDNGVVYVGVPDPTPDPCHTHS